MKNLSIAQVKLQIVREWLFIALLAGAPFSFNPSISTPAFGFFSLRIGLYQCLVVMFVVLMLPVLWQHRLKLVKDPLVLLSVSVLGVLAVMSPFRSLNTPRSALMSSAFVLLLMLLLSGWAYAKTLLSKNVQHDVFRAIVIVGLAVACFGILQFIYNTFSANALGLCANCGAHVFGFPRINGLAAEPQFLASSLIPPILLVYGYLMRQKNGLRAYIIFGVLVFTLALTLSRGAYAASLVSFVSLTIILLVYKKLRWVQVAKASLIAVAAGLLAVSAMVASASYRHHRTNPRIVQETISTIVEHVSGGVIDLPYNNPKPVASVEDTPLPEPTAAEVPAPTPGASDPATAPIQNPEPEPEFQSPGLIEASHKDRESAASLGLRWWQKDKITMALGIGVGNLGSYAYDQNPSHTLSFTIYIQYVFMLVEIGVIGLVSFLLLMSLAIIRAIKLASKATTTFGLVLAAVLIGFMVHYFFFGTYINAVYVWLYTGIGLGLTAGSKQRTKSKTKI